MRNRNEHWTLWAALAFVIDLWLCLPSSASPALPAEGGGGAGGDPIGANQSWVVRARVEPLASPPYMRGHVVAATRGTTWKGDWLAWGPARDLDTNESEPAVVLLWRPTPDSAAGSATQWREITTLEPPAELRSPWMGFGESIAAHGDLIAVGAPYADSGAFQSGAVFLFEATPDAPESWTLVGSLSPTHPAANMHFGMSVALSSDVLAVGSPDAPVERHPRAGRVDLFALTDGGGVSLAASVFHHSPSAADRFGAALDLEFNSTTGFGRLLIGAPGRDVPSTPAMVSNAGEALLFGVARHGSSSSGSVALAVRSAGRARSPTPVLSGYFGSAVALLESHGIAVGEPRAIHLPPGAVDDMGALSSAHLSVWLAQLPRLGAVHVGAPVPTPEPGSTVEENYIEWTSLLGVPSSHFGSHLSAGLDGTSLLAGAPGLSVPARGGQAPTQFEPLGGLAIVTTHADAGGPPTLSWIRNALPTEGWLLGHGGALLDHDAILPLRRDPELPLEPGALLLAGPQQKARDSTHSSP